MARIKSLSYVNEAIDIFISHVVSISMPHIDCIRWLELSSSHFIANAHIILHIFSIEMFYLSDIDECIVSPPCGDNANCNNTEGSYECECNTGFSGDGLNCSGIHNK